MSILKNTFRWSYNYNLLILTKNTKKSSRQLKAQKKTKLVLFPSRIFSCQHNCLQYTTVYTTNTHGLWWWDPSPLHNTSALIGVRKWRIENPLQHRLSEQRWADSIKMSPNAVIKFNHPFGVQIICLGFLWILINVDKMFLKIWNLICRDTALYKTKCKNWCQFTESL